MGQSQLVIVSLYALPYLKPMMLWKEKLTQGWLLMTQKLLAQTQSQFHPGFAAEGELPGSIATRVPRQKNVQM